MALYLGATFVAGLLTLAHIKTSDLINDHENNYKMSEQNSQRAAELYYQGLHLERLKQQAIRQRDGIKISNHYTKLLEEQRKRYEADIKLLTQPHTIKLPGTKKDQ